MVTQVVPQYSQIEAMCGSTRLSVCDGHEADIICVHNFLSQKHALRVRDRLDLLAKQMASVKVLSKRREDGRKYNQTQVLRIERRYETSLRAQLWHGAQKANIAGSWGYKIANLDRNVEPLQSVRYEAPYGWYAEHVDTRFTWNHRNDTYNFRIIAAIVQLSNRGQHGDYTGGELQAVLRS
jgi:hypothetical protein